MSNDSKHDDIIPQDAVEVQELEAQHHLKGDQITGVNDAVWGEINANGPNYRNLGWIRCFIILVKSQIGLGVLGIPSILHTVGLVPGLIIIIAIGTITTWSDYVVGAFKLNHPEVYTVADAGMLMFGPIGRELFGVLYWLYQTACGGGGILAISVALNALSDHGACTVVFVVVSAIAVGLVSSIQTLDRVAWFGWAGLVGVVASLLMLTVAVGVQDRPSAAPPTGPWSPNVRAFADASFVDAMGAVSTVIFAYAGTPSFFNIVSEMREPRDFKKAILACQGFVTMVFLIIGSVVYHYCGQYVSSPALGSAGPLLKKVAYGLSLPGLLVGAVLALHFPAKYVFVRVLRNSRHLSENTLKHYLVWGGIVSFEVIIAFIIAESIPIFGDLVSLIGALLGSFLSIETEAMMWLWDNWHGRRTLKWKLLTGMNVIFLVLGTFATVAGTYGAVVTIHKDLKVGSTAKPFSCAAN